MNCHESFIGIDVSKEWLDIAIGEKCFRINQDIEEIDAFINKHLRVGNVELCVLENTGGYERLMVERLIKANLKVHKAHASRVREFAKASGMLAKTDRLDAYVLSAYGKFVEREATLVEINPAHQQLKDLRGRYEQIKEMLHGEQCRYQTPVDEGVKSSIGKVMKVLKKELERIQEEIECHLKKDAFLRQRQQILCSMKGVGKVISQALVIDLPELGRLSRKKIAALVGVAPMNQQSGKRKGYASIQQGRSEVRRMLYVGALVAVRHNKVMKEFYERLLAAGKRPKIGLVAVMRKMLVTLNAMVRDGKEWEAA